MFQRCTCFVVLACGFLSPTLAAAAPPSEATGLPVAVRWWGQACVSIETMWGLTLVIDPHPAGERMGLPQLDLTADLVLVTHEHFDHNNVKAIKGKPAVLRGLTPQADWADIDHVLDRPPNETKPSLTPAGSPRPRSDHAAHVRTIEVFHDDQSGTKRGKNTLFLIDTNGLRFLHCGDLGHVLTNEQVKAIGPIDVLLIPVGGTYTIDAKAAMRVAKQLEPRRWVWPIHYNTGTGKLPLAKIAPFLAEAQAAGWPVRKIKGNTAALTAATQGKPPVGPPTVIVSDFKPRVLGDESARAFAAGKADRQGFIDALGKVTAKQLDHKPSNGTHTIRWNFEHTIGRELLFFSRIYHALDDQIPVLDWNPAQMPPDYRPRKPSWDTDEMVREVQRVGAFTERFNYLLADVPVDQKIKNTRFSIRSLTRLMIGHYRGHAAKAVEKFKLPDWPED